MYSKTINKAIHKNKYQMHNIECLMDNIAQSITQSSNEGQILFSTIDVTHTANYQWMKIQLTNVIST